MSTYNKEYLTEDIAQSQLTEKPDESKSDDNDAVNSDGDQHIDCKPGAAASGNTYRPHELSSIFPPMSEGEFQKLKESIKDNGLREPIWLYDGQIIDGRNRYNACVELNVEPKYIKYEGTDSLVNLVFDLNLNRRHLSDSQKAVVAAKALPFLEAEAKERQKATQIKDGKPPTVCEKIHTPDNGRSTQQAAEMAQVNYHYVSDAKKILNEAPEVAEDVEAGKLSITQAIQKLKRQKAIENLGAREKNQIKDDAGVYDVIVVNPAWPKKQIDKDDNTNQPKVDCPAMSIKQIKELNLPVADNCHLFLWTTQEFLPHAFNMLKVWELQYVCTLALLKSRDICSSRSPADNLEFCLYAQKGTPEFVDHKDLTVVFEGSGGGDNEKPEHFYEMVRQITSGSRLDRFSTKKIEGFDSYGFEAANNLDR